MASSNGKCVKCNRGRVKTGASSRRSMDECIAREGRPYGGCAILWKLSVKFVVKELKCNHVRLCGIMIQINNCEIMCLNVYMPCDGWSEDDKFAEYMDVLAEIQPLIHTYNPGHVIHTYNPAHVIHTYNPAYVIHTYNPAHVIYGGYMNTDLTRNTPHAYAVRNFISDFNLTVCIDAPDA